VFDLDAASYLEKVNGHVVTMDYITLHIGYLGFSTDSNLIIDAGDLPSSKPSAIYDCTIWPPKILRE